MNNDEQQAAFDDGTGIVEALPQYFGLSDDGDSKILRRALAVAAVLHVAILLVHLPSERALEIKTPQAQKLYTVQQIRFQPPAPQRREMIPKKKARKIPIPDPTPDEPEPILTDELDVPEIEMPVESDFVFGIPDAPPGVPTGAQGAYQIGGDISPPVKLHAPQPSYTEEARKARVQGVVILKTVIDTVGDVTQVEVLKGLTMGLTDSAIETIRGWKYRPATRGGEAVPVYLNVMVSFSLQ